MTTEEKFKAAVNVIRSLPKNGSYQPSNELMLRFYGYFKQATQGPCIGGRPAFWDIVGRAKYDAWKRLGEMPKMDAMTRYVEELHTIVETMSYSDKVASFLDAPSSELDSLKLEDLQLVVGDVIERVRSQPNSPLASREASPNRLISSLSSSRSVSPDEDSTDHSDGEYVDTIENLEPRKNMNSIPVDVITNGYIGHRARSKLRGGYEVDISQEISKTVQCLRLDLNRLSHKVNMLEKSRAVTVRRNKGFFGISNKLLFFIITWPFIANFILNRFNKRRT